MKFSNNVLSLLLGSALTALVAGQECTEVCPQTGPISMWRRPSEIPLGSSCNCRSGPGIPGACDGSDPPPAPTPSPGAPLISEDPFLCPDNTRMDATSPDAAIDPTAFVKVVNIDEAAETVFVEITQAFSGDAVPFVAVQYLDKATGQPSCNPPTTDVAAGAVAAQGIESKCTNAESMIAVYAGQVGSTATPGCTDAPGVTVYTFTVPCTCPEPEVLPLDVNTYPVAVDDYFTGVTGQSVTGNVLGTNDPTNPDAKDHSDDGVTDVGADSGITTLGGSWSVDANGDFVYEPVSPQFSGSDSFEYTISDGNGDSSSAVVHITYPANPVPTAVNDYFETPQDTPLTGVNVKNPNNQDDTDTKKDNSPDTVINVTPVTGGTTTEGGSYTLTGTGDLTYTPLTGFGGKTDKFVYEISDSTGDKATATVFIYVPVDTVPTAVDDYFTTAENEKVQGNVKAPNNQGVASDQDSSPDNTINVTPKTGGTTPKGTYDLLENGSFIYTPNTGATGSDSFEYEISDSNGDKDTATVYITIVPAPEDPKPLAYDDYFTTELNVPVTGPNANVLLSNPAPGITVTQVDFSPDGVIKVTEVPTKSTVAGTGTYTIDATGAFTYTPNPDFCCSDSFPYEIEDSNGDKATAVVYITIVRPDHAPVAVDDYYVTYVGTPVAGNVILNDTSLDGFQDVDDFSRPKQGEITEFLSDGDFIYTPKKNFEGRDSFTYQITDTDGDTASATVYIDVLPLATITGDDPDNCGFVTGGGWILLNENSYLKGYTDGDNPTPFANTKANFGFNAKYMKIGPDGSTNFDIDGNGFHFHSSTGGGAQYEDLEVVCQDMPIYPGLTGKVARWWGFGQVARTYGNPKGKDWVKGYRYHVAVIDEGEPSTLDNWRIRIFDLDNTVLFDNWLDGPPIWNSDPVHFPNPNDLAAKENFVANFRGSFLGGSSTVNGGGNIQMHCHGGPGCDKLDAAASTTTATTTDTTTTKTNNGQANKNNDSTTGSGTSTVVGDTTPPTTDTTTTDTTATGTTTTDTTTTGTTTTTTTTTTTPDVWAKCPGDPFNHVKSAEMFSVKSPALVAPMCGETTMKGLMASSTEELTSEHHPVEPFYSDLNIVKVAGYQTLMKKSISWICFVWTDSGSKQVAQKIEGMSDTDVVKFEAKCNAGTSKVDVYAHDGQIPKEEKALYPKECAGTQQEGTVKYTLTINCDQAYDDTVPSEVSSASSMTGAQVTTYVTEKSAAPKIVAVRGKVKRN